MGHQWGCGISKRRPSKQRDLKDLCDDPGDPADFGGFEAKFRAGDKLAPFTLAKILEMGGASPQQVPEWLVNYFISLGANYFSEARVAARTGRDPSLDRLAELDGKPLPWKKNAVDHQALLVAFHFDRIVAEARDGSGNGTLVCDPAIPRGDPRRSELSNRTHFTDGICEPVRVLDNRACPRPTKAFQIALGKCLDVVPNSNAVTDDGIYRAVRKCLDKARAI